MPLIGILFSLRDFPLLRVVCNALAEPPSKDMMYILLAHVPMCEYGIHLLLVRTTVLLYVNYSIDTAIDEHYRPNP